jgi:hypothetical protein
MEGYSTSFNNRRGKQGATDTPLLALELAAYLRAALPAACAQLLVPKYLGSMLALQIL